MAEKNLSDEKLKHYEEILLQEKENALKLIGQLSEMYRKGAKDNSGDLSGYSYHQADQGSDTHEQEKTAYLIDTEQQKMKQITVAIKKIYDKSYGICEICGCHIQDTRLKIIPYARFCIDCKTKEEKKKR
ncbi:MAG: TraR/DksA family transcriptional regulator [Candidatus Cloacimonetes bacterium]|nr:TraR/DksA family transcriptional regulator [Candidatus Cloacimonadota bacterium]